MSQPDANQEADDDSKRLEFEDDVELDATKEALWETISDPTVLTDCVPGAESIERVSDRKYAVEITRGVSHLTVSLSGEAEFVEMNPPEHVVTTGNVFDAKTGSDFDVLAAMEMREGEEGGVRLSYRAEVTFSGGVAALGPSVLRPIVERDVNTYFENVRERVESA